MKIIEKPLAEILPYIRNPRKNDDAVKAVAASIKEFGFMQPIVLDKENIIIAGHTRYKAAESLGLKTAPCVIAEDLTEAQIKAYRIIDNKVGEKAEWDNELLALELADLNEIDWSMFDVSFSDLPTDLESIQGTSDESSSGASMNYIVVGKYRIPISDEDYLHIAALINDHEKEFGTLHGFAARLSLEA